MLFVLFHNYYFLLRLLTCTDASLKKMYALVASPTQLITPGVRNRLLPYVKISNLHRSNPSPLKYSYRSQLAI